MKQILSETSYMALLWALAFFAPTYSFILLIGFFCICDMFTGILAHAKEQEMGFFRAVQSLRLRQTVRKFMAYGVAILVTHVICVKFIPDFPGLKLIGGFICLVEVKSIDENIKRVTGFGILGIIIKRLEPKSPNTKP